MSHVVHYRSRGREPAAHGGLQCRWVFGVHIVAGQIDPVDEPRSCGPRTSGRAGVRRAPLGDDLKPLARGALGLQPS